ncbi:MAG TPA: amidohydrolase [Firmicutes bacterium]|jgi:predicted TIM-barrel fold metal-dependent hydrolase|nr:amidohydrolase [Bacillota bacterium]
MIIDMHVHPAFLDSPVDIPEFPEEAAGGILTSTRVMGRDPMIMSVDGFIQEMEDAGIDMVGLLVPSFKGLPTRPKNEQVAKLVKMYPDKFIGFAGFDPNQGKHAVAEIEYAVTELGYKGIKVIGPTVEVDINDRAYYPCYAKIQELGVPVVMHTGVASLLIGYRVKHALPLMVDDIAFDFPDLKIVCAHLGAQHYMDVHSLMVRHPNVYADVSFWPMLPHNVDLIPWQLLEETVPDKIFLGSDYPTGNTPGEAVEAVKNLPISEDFKKKILGDNAAKFLGL